jgi:hypothetical protein
MTDLTSEPDLLSSTAQDQVVNILDSVIDTSLASTTNTVRYVFLFDIHIQ